MLQGAADVARSGAFVVTAEHHAAIARWREANNSALQFLLDDEWCVRDPSDPGIAGSVLYASYRKWAGEAGVRPFGRTGFYDAIDEGAGRIGVSRRDDRAGVRFAGVSLVARSY
jgi:putative DNA primase/helicase